MIKSLLQALFDLFAFRFAKPETVTFRRETCNPCEARNKTLDICTICSCHIPTKIKLKNSKCPMELW